MGLAHSRGKSSHELEMPVTVRLFQSAFLGSQILMARDRQPFPF